MYGMVSQLTVVPKMVLVAWRTGVELTVTPPTPPPSILQLLGAMGAAFCNDGL